MYGFRGGCLRPRGGASLWGVRVSKDGASITGKGGSGRWARQAAAQASISTNSFPISGLLRPADFYRLPAALLGQCPWTDPEVCMETSVVFGADRKMADRYITNVCLCGSFIC